jgi:hypothetical protein
MKQEEFGLLEPFQIPERTRLYRLPPVVANGAYRESLGSYYRRLADKHCASPYILARQIVAPDFGDFEAERTKTDESWKHPFFHSCGEVAQMWSNSLNRLTGQSMLGNLTFVPLADLLHKAKLTAKTRQWCPCCFADDAEKGQPPYGRLLWEADVVKACPMHRIELQSACDCSAEKKLHSLNVKFMPNLCEKCGRDFMRFKTLTTPASREDVLLSKKVANLLDDPAFDGAILAGGFAKFITKAIASLNKGVSAHFADRIGKSKSVVHGWVTLGRIPPLSDLAHLSVVLGCEIADMLTGHADDLLDVAPVQKEMTKPGRQAVDASYFAGQLAEFAAETPCISVREAARRLGTDQRVLYLRFGELAKALSAKYLSQISDAKAARDVARRLEMKSIFDALVREGIHPSRHKVAERMSSGKMFLPEDKAYYLELRAARLAG